QAIPERIELEGAAAVDRLPAAQGVAQVDGRAEEGDLVERVVLRTGAPVHVQTAQVWGHQDPVVRVDDERRAVAVLGSVFEQLGGVRGQVVVPGAVVARIGEGSDVLHGQRRFDGRRLAGGVCRQGTHR